MHRELAPERRQRLSLPGQFQRDKHADAAKAVDHRAVHIMANDAMGDMQALRAAQRDVFADRRDGVGDRLGDRAAAGEMRARDRLGGHRGPLVERDRRDAAHQRLKIVVARHEIGL